VDQSHLIAVIGPIQSTISECQKGSKILANDHSLINFSRSRDLIRKSKQKQVFNIVTMRKKSTRSNKLKIDTRVEESNETSDPEEDNTKTPKDDPIETKIIEALIKHKKWGEDEVQVLHIARDCGYKSIKTKSFDVSEIYDPFSRILLILVWLTTNPCAW